ncbi:hypothetical protein [Pseudonocardia sp. GCM10023141]|uniref:hypothetical protein n=1 Tax=Pseudonocardia sp. GCM10023141 TaxID=3252653 RepID=UPI00361A2B90
MTLELRPHDRRVVADGVVHIPGWLGIAQQRFLAYSPYEAVISYYSDNACLGSRRDTGQRAPEPVVHVSLGAPSVVRLRDPSPTWAAGVRPHAALR